MKDTMLIVRGRYDSNLYSVATSYRQRVGRRINTFAVYDSGTSLSIFCMQSVPIHIPLRTIDKEPIQV